MKLSDCPDPAVLFAFHLGKLGSQLFEELAAHVADCANCQKWLDEQQSGLQDDPLLAWLRRLESVETSPSIPGYELLGVVGEGGMGIVYRAVDTRLRREVAIKLLKQVYGGNQKAMERFLAEAMVSAQLQHPGVPPVHEVGSLPNGQPFLSMKLVKGCTLHELLKDRPAPEYDRGRMLAIFEQVCYTVGYAHAHHVIHRDLKPSNVMVGAYGEVYVMDWGLAKVLGSIQDRAGTGKGHGVSGEITASNSVILTPERTDSTTRMGSVLGTPAYMPPEQARGDIEKIDARSDVFALGVMLCEILTGRPVYAAGDAQAVCAQAVRGVTQEALERLHTCGADSDLVALCQSCLALRPEDRPVDGNAVAKEVARIRQAAEERARQAEMERAQALIRYAEQRKRRRLLQFMGAAITSVLLVGLSASLWQTRRALIAERQTAAERDAKAEALLAETVAREEAGRRRREAEEARQKALQRLAQLEKGNAIIASIFTDLDIRKIKQTSEPLEAVLAQRLVRAAQQLEGEAVGDPLVVAELQRRLGCSLLNLGQTLAAIDLCRKAFETRASLLGRHHPDTLAVMNSLALACMEAGRLTEAIPLFEETLTQTKLRFGPDHPNTLTSANNLATAYERAGKYDLAISLYEEIFKLRKARPGDDYPNMIITINNLATAYQTTGRMDKALSLLEEAMRIGLEKLGPDHPDTLTIMNNLAMVIERNGEVERAIPLLERILELRKAKLGPDHPSTLKSMNNLATAYKAAGKMKLALPLLENVLDLNKAKFGADHPTTLTSMNNLALVYKATGKMTLALKLYEEALSLTKAKLGIDHSLTLTTMNNLGWAYKDAGKPEFAIPLLEETFKLAKAKLGPDHPLSLTAMNSLAEAHRTAGNLKMALPLLEDTVKYRKAKLGPDHPETLSSMASLALAYWASNKLDLALPLFEEIVSRSTAKLGPDHPDTLLRRDSLALAYKAAGRHGLALPLLEESLRLSKGKLGIDHPASLTRTHNLASCLLDAGQLEKALLLLEENLTLRKGKLGIDHSDTLKSMETLAAAYKKARKLNQALCLLEEIMSLRTAKLGPDHPDTLSSIASLAEAYCEAGKRDQALRLFGQAATGIEKIGYPSKYARPILAGTISAYEAAEQFEQAEVWRRKWLKVIGEREGSETTVYGDELALLGLNLLRQEKWSQAESVLRECLAIRERLQADMWTTFNTMSLLGGALLGQKKYSDAEPLLVSGCEGMMQREAMIPPQGKIRVSEALDRLIKLYTATNRPNEIQRYRELRGRFPAGKE